MMRTRQLATTVLGWPVGSQQRARRNALVATTALTRQRIERDEVERFLEAHARRVAARAGHRGRHPAQPGSGRRSGPEPLAGSRPA